MDSFSFNSIKTIWAVSIKDSNYDTVILILSGSLYLADYWIILYIKIK